jgi:hypothetical protein
MASSSERMRHGIGIQMGWRELVGLGIRVKDKFGTIVDVSYLSRSGN